MKITEQSFEIIDPEDGEKALKRILKIGRYSHGVQNKDVTIEGAENFIQQHCILSRPQHTTLLEFADVIVVIKTDRAIANEIVRHRMASYNQQSTRYVAYKDGIEVIPPLGMKENNPRAYVAWFNSCLNSERSYLDMRRFGATPEECRDVLPLSTATYLVMKMNLNSLRNFFYLRTEEHAHPKMRELANMILKELQKRYHVVFDDFEVE